MSRKKIILISLLAITVIVSGFVVFHFLSNDNNSKVDTSKQLKTNIKEEKKDKTDNKETEKEETNPEITTPQTNETENQNIEEVPKENSNTNNVHTPQPQTPSNKQTTQTQPKPTAPPVVEQAPSCTPKLFYSVFRPDFDNFDKLLATEKQYEEIYGFTGYEYMSATDDCGDTYYQLTMKYANGQRVEYSDIPKP